MFSYDFSLRDDGEAVAEPRHITEDRLTIAANGDDPTATAVAKIA